MKIDIFNHFMPKVYLDRLADLIPNHVALTAFPRLKTLVDVDARLRLIDEFDGLQTCSRSPIRPSSWSVRPM